MLLNQNLPPKKLQRQRNKECFHNFADFTCIFSEKDLFLKFFIKTARKMPNLKKMPNEIFPCQTLLKNAKFVISGIEKCQLSALQDLGKNPQKIAFKIPAGGGIRIFAPGGVRTLCSRRGEGGGTEPNNLL